MGPIQNLHELLSWLGRRWQVIALITAMGVVAGLIMAMQTERVYSASAVIQVINPVIAVGDEGGSATTPDVTRRAQIIEQRLMSREALLDLADRFDLFEGVPLSTVEQVGLMRESMSISAIAAAQQGFTRDGSLSALIVSASNSDPVKAAAIANFLADSLIRESESDRQNEAQQTVDFFRAAEERLETEIAALEIEIATYSSENEGYLPAAIAIRRAEQGRMADSLLALEQEVSIRRNELAGQDTGSTRAVTQRRVAQLTDEIAQLTHQSDVLSTRMAEIQAVLEAAPVVEQQLIAMNRRMEQFQAQLTSAADRRREAELGARIEVDQQAERFELLERALVPDYPISRSRKKVALMGVIGGLMLGLMLAYAMEWLKPVMRTAQRVERDLQLRPVMSIPYAMPAVERRRRKMIWAAGLVVLIAGIATVAKLLGIF
ncbi:GumC family protein [Pararhodobacter sp.]|uniref:GumC family protein n=1 Tax=Pararhodobacter sp. TaxID=2127056 RepID=UPI002AFF9A06|nr:Wzz/FepE/Etk N-terminal domain-containing protein [Pararhodobacter sp.]